MKLRQKLAAILATSMVASLVPVVTMAASSNTLVKTETVVEEDTLTTSASLRIKFADTTGSEEFYFTLTNAKWADATKNKNTDKYGNKNCDATVLADLGFTDAAGVADVEDLKQWQIVLADTENGANVTVKYYRQSDSTIRVTVSGLQEDAKIAFPLPFVATGGTASVALTSESSSATSITEGSYSLMTTGEEAGVVTVDTTKMQSFYDQGELAPIEIKESFVGSMRSSDMILKIELQDTNFKFHNPDDMTATGLYGFATLNSESDDTKPESKVEFAIDDDDKSILYVHITGLTGSESLGRIRLEGLSVDADDLDDIEVGDLTADISTVKSFTQESWSGADLKLEDNVSDLKVANIVNYSVYFKLDDDKTVDIVGGRDEKVKFRVYESTDDVFVNGRKIYITLKDAQDKSDEFFWVQSEDDRDDADDYFDQFELDTVEDEDIIEDIKIEWKDSTTPDEGKWAKATGITLTLNDSYKDDDDAMNVNEQVDWFEINPYIYVPVDKKDRESVSLVGSYRSEEFTQEKAVNIINPFDVTGDSNTLKVGLQDQAVSTVTLKETDAKMLMSKNFEANETSNAATDYDGLLKFSIDNGSNGYVGMSIDSKGTFTVAEGSVKTSDFGVSNTIDNSEKNVFDKVTIKRQSKAAATITISDMKVTVDRTVPEGSYDLKVGGAAVDQHGTWATAVSKFIVIGTANTQDIAAANGLEKGTATFTIGSTSYTKDGAAVTMDAAPYILDPGYTMVPVRYVAKAFGVAESDIMFGQGTVTIIAGNRTIGLTNGSNVAVVNGVNVTMDAPVVIKEGRTYAPISQIANILGISSAWDNDTKTATFTN